MFKDKDLAQIAGKGITIEGVNQQLKNFETGFPFMQIIRAATIGDGILKFSTEVEDAYIELFNQGLKQNQVCKFTPASGAASRMFKALFEFVQKDDNTLIDAAEYTNIKTLFERIKDFAFYNDLNNILAKKGKSLSGLLAAKNYVAILKGLLTIDGLNYGALPKGLLKFHSYTETMRTAAEEHLVEGANYCNDLDNVVTLHFTVSPEHQSAFTKHLNEVKEKYEKQFGVKYDISFSIQEPYTDTIAVDTENQPFRLDDRSILFRPGGHGALIENLNTLQADILFIKNIDNVVPDALKADTFRYKKILGGVLLDRQAKVFNYLNELEKGAVENELLEKITAFLKNELYSEIDIAHLSDEEKRAYLIAKLNRPIRVCGMVKNVGEPGGGPFWSTNADGTVSLQIVESSQIERTNPQQEAILLGASHFNPVDLVCSTKNYKGEKFDLLNFRDPQTGFIASKSKNGRSLKAQELPGLWNGAMADWNTIFVEVPIVTFNPVKTVNDLLRKEHQA